MSWLRRSDFALLRRVVAAGVDIRDPLVTAGGHFS